MSKKNKNNKIFFLKINYLHLLKFYFNKIFLFFYNLIKFKKLI